MDIPGYAVIGEADDGSFLLEMVERLHPDIILLDLSMKHTGGLDALRRSGWKGNGPIPWSHEPNRGFLRSLAALGRAAAAIGEAEEATRCRTFLADSDSVAASELGFT